MSEAPTIHPDWQTSKSESQAIKGQVGNSKTNTPASDKPHRPVMLLNPQIGCPKDALLKSELERETPVQATKMSTGNGGMYYE